MTTYPAPAIIFDPSGFTSVTMAFTDGNGNTVTAYSDAFALNSIATPITCTARTTYYFTTEQPIIVSAKVNNVEMCGTTFNSSSFSPPFASIFAAFPPLLGSSSHTFMPGNMLTVPPGLLPVATGTKLTTALVTSTISAGYAGWYLDPRVVWDSTAGINWSGISNFTVFSYMGGSIGWLGKFSISTGYINTGSGYDGWQLYGQVGSECQGITFYGLAFKGSNTNAVLHYGGRERGCLMQTCYVENDATTPTAQAYLSGGTAYTATVAAGSNGLTPSSWTPLAPLATLQLSAAVTGTLNTQGGFLSLATSTPGTAYVAYGAVSGNNATGVIFLSGDAAGTIATGGAVASVTAPCGIAYDSGLGASGFNSEGNYFQAVDIVGGYTCLNLGTADRSGAHPNDTQFQIFQTCTQNTTAPCSIIAINGGNNQFLNFYDRTGSLGGNANGGAPLATVLSMNKARLQFLSGELQNGSTAGGVSAAASGASAEILLNGTSVTQSVSTYPVLVGSGATFIARTGTRFNSGGVNIAGATSIADLNDQSIEYSGTVNINGTTGTAYLPSAFNNGTPTLTAWTGTTQYPTPGVLQSSSASGQAAGAASTTVAAGSNGGVISNIAAWGTPGAGQLAVAANSMTASGFAHVVTSIGTTLGLALIQYTGGGGTTTLTGCTYITGASAAATVATGGNVFQATAVAGIDGRTIGYGGLGINTFYMTPAASATYRVDLQITPTVAGTSTVPSLQFTTIGNTLANTNPTALWMWRLDGSTTTPSFLCAAAATFVGTMTFRASTAGPIWVQIVPTTSTYKYVYELQQVTSS